MGKYIYRSQLYRWPFFELFRILLDLLNTNRAVQSFYGALPVINDYPLACFSPVYNENKFL